MFWTVWGNRRARRNPCGEHPQKGLSWDSNKDLLAVKWEHPMSSTHIYCFVLIWYPLAAYYPFSQMTIRTFKTPSCLMLLIFILFCFVKYLSSAWSCYYLTKKNHLKSSFNSCSILKGLLLVISWPHQALKINNPSQVILLVLLIATFEFWTVVKLFWHMQMPKGFEGFSSIFISSCSTVDGRWKRALSKEKKGPNMFFSSVPVFECNFVSTLNRTHAEGFYFFFFSDQQPSLFLSP